MPFHVVKLKRGFKVQDDKGNFYSKKPLTKKRAVAQQRALYASEARGAHFSGTGFASWVDGDDHHIIIQGNGFFSNLFNKVRNIGTNIIGSITASPLSSASNVVSQGIREDYPPKVRQILEQYGDANVIKLTIIREPIKRFIDYALNIISLGRWGEAKKRLNYDKLFHLYMIATLQLPNGNKGYLKFEKNEVINITTELGTRDEQAEYMEVPVPCCLTVFDMMNKTRQMVGAPLFKYEAFNNNCQVFLLNILKANDLANPQIAGFISQGVESLLQELPNYVRPFANLTTNIAGLANRVIYGRGEKPPPFINTSAKVDHPTTLTAQQINDLMGRLQFSDDMSRDEQYNIINDVLDYLLSDPQYLQERYDRFEISHARGVLSESRDSKPQEFVNIIEKVLEDLEPEVEGGSSLSTLEGSGRYKDQLAEMGDAFKLMYTYVVRPFSEEELYPEFLQAFHSVYNDAVDDINRNEYNRPAKQQVLDRFKRANIRKLIELMAEVGKDDIYALYGEDLHGIPVSIRGDIKAGIEIIDELIETRRQEALANAPPPPPQPELHELMGTEPEVGIALQAPEEPGNLGLIEPPLMSSSTEEYIPNEEAPGVTSYTPAVEGQGQSSSRITPFTEEESEMFEYMRTVPGFNSLSRTQKIRVVKEMVHHEKAVAEMEAKEAENPSNLVITGPTGERSFATKVEGSGEEIHINPLFKRQLKQVRIKPHKYLEAVRQVAEDAGYDPSMLYFSDDGSHKLMYLSPDGKKTHFGAVEYGDYLIWSHLEELGKVQKGYAAQKRNVFRKSHCKIKGDWKKDKYSANQLALSILWGDAKCS